MSMTIERICINCGNPSGDEVLCEKCDKKGSKTLPSFSNFNTKKSARPVKKFPFDPFIAIKLESSGLPDDENSQILEVAAAFGDYGVTSANLRPNINFYIKRDPIHWHEDARKVVGYIEEDMKSGRLPVYTQEEAQEVFRQFLIDCQKISGSWKNILVGRNIYSFVIPMLKKEGFYFDDLIDHQCLDLTSLFYFKMRQRCTTQQILKNLQIDPPDFKGLNEVWAVISAMYEEAGKELNVPTYNWY